MINQPMKTKKQQRNRSNNLEIDRSMTNTTVHSCVIETRNHMGMDNSKFTIQIRTGTTNLKCFQQFFPCQNGFYKFMRDTLDSHMLLRIMILLFKTLDRTQGQREEGESGSNCPKQSSNNHENYYGNENRVESVCHRTRN